jgi:hypothetical protein
LAVAVTAGSLGVIRLGPTMLQLYQQHGPLNTLLLCLGMGLYKPGCRQVSEADPAIRGACTMVGWLCSTQVCYTFTREGVVRLILILANIPSWRLLCKLPFRLTSTQDPKS